MRPPKITPLIAPNVRVAVHCTINPHADYLHRHGGPTEDQLLGEIRQVLVDHETHRDRPLLDSDLAYMAAAAQVILERRVAQRAAA